TPHEDEAAEGGRDGTEGLRVVTPSREHIMQALDVLDGMSQAEIGRLREGIAATVSKVNACRADGSISAPAASGTPSGWCPVSIALFYVLWTTSAEYLEQQFRVEATTIH